MTKMVMINTAEEAVAAVTEFLAGHYRYGLPVSAKRKGEFWRVVFDVGALKGSKLAFEVNVASGVVTGFCPLVAPMSESAGKVRWHVIHSRRYFDKALAALGKRDAWESGKLIWRSVEQALLGAAASRHYMVTDRRDLNAFVGQFKDTPDGEQFILDFRAAALGEGFQAIEPNVQDIEDRLSQARRTLAFAFALIPDEIAAQVQAPGHLRPSPNASDNGELEKRSRLPETP